MITRDALLGSWALESVEVMHGDEVVDPAPFGKGPTGFIHYLADRRMAVLIAHGGRQPMAGGRAGASDEARLAAARTFTAYAGTFDVEGNVVVHHVDMNSFPNDVGADYVRIASLDGDKLILGTPPDLPADQRPMRLTWKRYSA